MANVDTKEKIKTNLKLKEPGMFKVVYLNDEVTTMEFVVGSLITYFNYDEKNAFDRTVAIHQEGSAVVAVMPYELAEQKGVEVQTEAQNHGFPLQVKIESE